MARFPEGPLSRVALNGGPGAPTGVLATPAPSRDTRRLVTTSTPGVYRRERADGTLGGYVVIYRTAGRQRKESARTLAEARAIRAARAADEVRGEFHHAVYAVATGVAFAALDR